MPRRPLRPCAHPGCPELVSTGRCERHRKRKASRDAAADVLARGSAADRGYDSAWRKVRRIKLARDPLCERCAADGRTRVADMVHHRVPVKEDPSLRLVLENLESLCNSCHAAAHAGGD